jgi:hypothetical protein
VSDFLSTLSDRALGKDVPLSPRLRSLFEPERLVFGTGLGWAQASSQWAEGTPAGVRPAAETAAGRELDPGPGGAGPGWPESPAPGAGQAVTAWRASEPRDGRPGSLAPAATPPVSAPAFPVGTIGESAVPLPSHPEEPDTPGAGQDAGIRLGPRGARAGRLPREPSRARVRAADPGQLPVGGIEPPPSARPILREDAWPVPAGPGVQPAGVLSTGSGMAGRAYDVLAARVLRPYERNRAPQNPSPEPVINITIGRVDVRAAPASEGERRAEPAPRGGPEPLSLNEYLHRREQGR